MPRSGQIVVGHALQVAVSSDALTETWRVVHLDTGVQRHLRVLRPEARAHAADWAAICREQRRMIHPFRLQVYEVTEVDGLPAVLVEACGGPSLWTWSRARSRPLDEVLQVFAEVADAIGMAHDAGVVHGAIDPRRIWMKPDAGVFSPRVDLAVGDIGNGLRLSPIRAPEQICDEPVDERTDLYLFGATLYEVVGGQTPLEPGIIGAIPLARVRPDAPTALVRLAAALLDTNPGKRPASIDDVRDQLIAIARGECDGPALPTWNETVEPHRVEPAAVDPLGRHRVAIAAAAALVGCVGAAAWLAYLS